MSVLTNNQEISEFCKRLGKENFIAVDTEFMRENTYWPKLCLIQLASSEEARIIDPLADNINLDPVYKLMKNNKIIKIFHSGRQDIEIFFNKMNEIPYPIFDTQIAGMVCGFGNSASYDSMVSNIVNKKIDKLSRFTDWSVRPLSKNQITYALNDVIYLLKIYKKLISELETNKRFEWIRDEIDKLVDINNYKIDPNNAWKKIKIKNNPKRLLPFIHKLAYWREMQAQKIDIPRNRIIRDEAIIEISSNQPMSSDELQKIRGISKSFAHSNKGSEIVDIVKKIKKIKNQVPLNIDENKKDKNSPDTLVDLLKLLLNFQSKKFGVSQNLIASVSDLHKIVNENNPDISVLNGWRYEVFGKAALDLKNGKTIIKVKNGKIHFKNI